MYKLLLCWRYLRTRYLALVCIVSVMLGVATLIVVNSVMAGFSTKLRERLHGLLSDLVIEAADIDGFPDPEGQMRKIRASAVGPDIAAMTPTLEVFALLQFPVRLPYRDATVTKTVRVIGVDPQGRAAVGGFAEYVFGLDKQDPQHPKLKSLPPTFDLSTEALQRYESRRLPPPPREPPPAAALDPSRPPPPEPWTTPPKVLRGAFVGFAIASFRDRHSAPGEVKDVYMLEPGDVIELTTVSGVGSEDGGKLTGIRDRCLVAGYFKAEMSEYDGGLVFVPLDYLQQLRGMTDRATSIQIRLHDYATAPRVKEALQRMFPSHSFLVQTWEDKQGALLAAISVERGILNVLLFMIVGVAGFGILAIFSMIVVEKTRDIGVLKALGASNRGVLTIFLGYGVLLGTVGAVLGTTLGLTITQNLNEIEQLVTRVTGQQVFDRSIYYFDRIPTFVQPVSVVLVNLGSVAIAVLFSVLPALRAAMLHPVRALRYE
jgi:lipoprotein-releasing system permease protein